MTTNITSKKGEQFIQSRGPSIVANWLCGSICIVHLLCLCTTFSFLLQWPMHGSSFFLGRAIISIIGILSSLSKHFTRDYINMSLEVVKRWKIFWGKKKDAVHCWKTRKAIYISPACIIGVQLSFKLVLAAFSMTLGMRSLYPIVEVKNVTSELILLQSLAVSQAN